jgi:hypothetical protein
MALSALRARLGLGLGRSCATRIGAGGNGKTATTAFGHNSGAGGFGKIRGISSSAETSSGSVPVAIGIIAALAQLGVGYVIVDYFSTLGDNVAKIQVAMDQLVKHETKPPVSSVPGER